MKAKKADKIRRKKFYVPDERQSSHEQGGEEQSEKTAKAIQRMKSRLKSSSVAPRGFDVENERFHGG